MLCTVLVDRGSSSVGCVPRLDRTGGNDKSIAYSKYAKFVTEIVREWSRITVVVHTSKYHSLLLNGHAMPAPGNSRAWRQRHCRQHIYQRRWERKRKRGTSTCGLFMHELTLAIKFCCR